MINLPNLLLIGAAERNLGKTELACEMIRKYTENQNVVGIKITVIKEANGKCPRGGEGCGVCSSVKNKYSVIRELNVEKTKDTSKMLKAGAKKVYWLKVLSEYLDEGVNALFEKIYSENNDELVFICESNSARLAINPGLFLVLRKSNSENMKNSCKKVIGLADRIIKFDSGYDISTKLIVYEGEKWTLIDN